MNEIQARAVVTQRSHGRCELCRSVDTLTYAHRLNRSHGGGWHPANALRLCWACHEWTEKNPTAAYAGGWRVEWPQDPAVVPVWLQPAVGVGWYLVNDKGDYKWLWPPDHGLPERPAELPPTVAGQPIG